MTPETGVTTTSAVVASAALGQVLGVDPQSLVWGLVGGLAMLNFQEPMGRVRAVSVVATASVTAAAFSGVAEAIVMKFWTGAPDLSVPTAFALGLLSQKIIPMMFQEMPWLLGWLKNRVFGK